MEKWDRYRICANFSESPTICGYLSAHETIFWFSIFRIKELHALATIIMTSTSNAAASILKFVGSLVSEYVNGDIKKTYSWNNRRLYSNRFPELEEHIYLNKWKSARWSLARYALLHPAYLRKQFHKLATDYELNGIMPLWFSWCSLPHMSAKNISLLGTPPIWNKDFIAKT